MKLAEALQERADIQRKIEEYRSGINNNVTVQEGETPPEDPKELREIENLIQSTNWTTEPI